MLPFLTLPLESHTRKFPPGEGDSDALEGAHVGWGRILSHHGHYDLPHLSHCLSRGVRPLEAPAIPGRGVPRGVATGLAI